MLVAVGILCWATSGACDDVVETVDGDTDRRSFSLLFVLMSLDGDDDDDDDGGGGGDGDGNGDGAAATSFSCIVVDDEACLLSIT